MDALGEVDAERFITLLNRDPFDYTIWQKENFEGKSVEQISSESMARRKK